MACHAGPSNGSWRTLEAIPSSMTSNKGSSIARFIDRHTFGTPLEQLPAIHRAAQHRIQVRVAADYSDSKPEASSYLGDLGYHPLEDISSHEKRKATDLTERRLTDAELARTIAEANETAILFASLWEDKDHVFGTEVEYLIDEKGDFYFQIDDHSEFLTTLHSTNSQMNVAIGYESIDDWILEQQQVLDESTPEDSKDDHSDDEGEQEETWAIVTADGTEYILEEMVEEEPPEEESIGNWSGLDTLASVHPLEFASALATAALADDKDEFEKPSQSLRIVGEVRRLNEEEEEYVLRLAENRFSREEGEEEDEDEEEENDEEGGEESTEEADASEQEEDVLVKTTSLSRFGESSRARGEEEEGHEHEGGTSYYKLDIKSIHVVSYFRAESTVDNSEFWVAKPDILARAAPEIIERLNSRGKVLEDALKSLCLHRKGLEVEEAALLYLDGLGMDLRVHCGREVRNLRISFSQRATSVEHAEQLLNELLFPQVPLRSRRKRRSWPQGKSS